MIIKGYLSEISFVELLRIISKHDGRLGVWNFDDKKQYESFFFNKQVVYFNVNKTNLTDLEQINKTILELCEDKKSYYAFQSNTLPPDSKESVASIDQLLSFTLTQNNSAVENKDHLPNLQTKFETVSKITLPVQGDLQDFWEKSAELLHKGCSGEEICNRFGFGELEVQESLHKLRTAGMLKPFRAFKVKPPSMQNGAFARSLNKINTQLNEKPALHTVNESIIISQENTVEAVAPQIEVAPKTTNENENFNFQLPPRPTILVPQDSQSIELPDFSSNLNSEISNTESVQILPEKIDSENEVLTQNTPENETSFQNVPEVETKTYYEENIQEFLKTIDENPSESSEVVDPSENSEDLKIHESEPFQSIQNNQYQPELNDSQSKTGLVRRMLNSLFR